MNQADVNQLRWIEKAKLGKTSKSVWEVEAQPHVAIRLKRLFPRANAGERVIRLHDTPEVARELAWFGQRFPLSGDSNTMRRLAERAEQHARLEADLEEIRAGSARLEGAVPINGQPRSYQIQAAKMACATRQLLLADEVGLGKTLSAITAFCQLGKFPVLVVTLTHLPRQWEAEINRFAPTLNTKILAAGQPGKSKSDCFDGLFGMPDVIICNYHKLTGWVNFLAPLIKVVVFDECQELRRSTSDKYSAAVEFANAAELRLGLSATPIFNYGGEIFNVLNCLAPDCIGTEAEFHREWCTHTYGDKARIDNPKAFGSYLRESGLMLRRTRADVGRELPGLQTIIHSISSDAKSLNTLTATAAELARKILDAAPSAEDRQERWKAAGQFDNQMRQATGISKAPAVAQFVRMLVENGEKVVLFGWHLEVYKLWAHLLRELKPVFYTGRETASQKDAAIRAFRGNETDVLVLSLRAGAGLDGLQHCCRTCVFGELDWSPGVHEQCIGRVARDGQQHPVVAYYLLADDGADPIMSDVLGVKTGQITGLRDPDAPLVSAGIDPNHLKRLAEDFLRRKGEL